MVRDPLPIGAHGVINLRKLRPGVWRARANYRDSRGVRRDVTAQAPTKAAAETKLKAKLATLPAAGAALEGSTTLKVALQRWLDGLDGLATNTVRNYTLLAGNLSASIGSLQLRELTAGILDAYLAGIKAPSARYNQRLVLKMALDEAVRLGALTHNPVLATRTVKGRKKKVRALTVEQVQQLRGFVAALPVTPTYSGYLPDLVDVLLGTGCRWGEGAGLRWQDVDMAAGTVTVRGTLIQGKGWQADTKTHESRTLQVPKFVLEVLQRRQATAAAGPVFVFEHAGKPLVYNSARSYLQKAIRGTDLEWVTWHVLRKTTATFLDEQLGLAEASAQLGHASEAQTARAYVARERGAAFAEVLEGLVGG